MVQIPLSEPQDMLRAFSIYGYIAVYPGGRTLGNSLTVEACHVRKHNANKLRMMRLPITGASAVCCSASWIHAER